jgi:outer membrane protein TolC
MAFLITACLAAAGVAQAAESLRPEWSVGQDQVSPELLKVTPPPPAPAELTVTDAVDLALRRNIGFRGTIQALLVQRSALYVALQRWDLTLNGSIDRVKSDSETATEYSAGGSFFYTGVTGASFSVASELQKLDSAERTETLTASLSQPLLAGSFRASAAYEAVRQARNSYRAALLSYFISRQDLIVSVLTTYFNAVQSGQLVAIQESSVKLAEQAVKDAQLRLEAGLIAEIDLTRAQLQLSQSQAALVSARQSEQDTVDQLLLLVGLQVGGRPKLVTTVEHKPAEIDADTAVAAALQRRPEIQLSELSIEDREAVLRISRSQRLPTLDMVGAVQRISDGATDQTWSLGLQTSVPIGSRALTEAVRQANWALLVSQQDREDLKQRVAAEVRSQVHAAEAARANVDIAAEGLAVAQRSFQIAGRMVEEGLATNRDLLDAQNALTTSGTALVTGRINHYLATVRLKRSMGIDVGTQLPAGRAETPAADTTGAGVGGT